MTGTISTKQLWDVNQRNLKRYMDKYLPFLHISTDCEHLDMGEANPKMQYIKKEFGISVHQVGKYDFNFDALKEYYDTADTIFALEIIEHLQNPLFFMREMKRCLKCNGSIYATIPVNAKWLWVDGHYFEIPREHFEKWILKPLGLKTVRYKRIVNKNYLGVGIRPILRVLTGKAHWKTLLRPIFYYKYDIYEIKKD